MCYSQIWQNFGDDEYLCKLGKEYLNASLCKYVVYSLQHSETFDVSHVFLPLTIAELSTLKQVQFFWPTLYRWSIVTMFLLGTVMEIWHLKDIGGQLWPFGVTWRHQSPDHLTCSGPLPIGGSLWPCVCLAPLWRYDARTLRWFFTLSNAVHCIGQTKNALQVCSFVIISILLACVRYNHQESSWYLSVSEGDSSKKKFCSNN